MTGWIGALALAACLLWGSVDAVAEDHGHHDRDAGHHVAESHGIRIVHAWARAAGAGETTHVFLEIENGTGRAVILAGGHAEIAESVDLVGFRLSAGEVETVEIGEVEVEPNGDFVLDPGGVGLELSGLADPLEEGRQFELELEIEPVGHLDVHVQVEAADATRHSHAGHAH